MDKISKKTRNEFREFLVGYTLHEIDILFDNEGFVPDEEYEPPLNGQRRCRVEQYYKNINFSEKNDIKRFLKVYEDVLCRLSQSSVSEEQNEGSYATTNLAELKRHIENDGYIFRDKRLSLVSTAPLQIASVDSLKQYGLPFLEEQLERLEEVALKDPALAIGTSKELIETVCKTILESRGVNYSKTTTLPQLVKKVRSELNLVPENIPNQTKGSEYIKIILSNFGSIADNLSNLRNLYGTGHGRTTSINKKFNARHGKLAAHSAITICYFLYETHLEQSSRSK